MKRWVAVSIVLLCSTAWLGAGEAETTRAVTEVLEAQAKAWNEGDIAGYMDHYWKSEGLTFSAEGSTARGWKATKERYDKRYTTRELMGRLTFDQLEVTPLGDDAALVLGRWRLDRENDAPGGNFSLVFRKLDDRWVIIHDHTSSSP